MSKWYEDIPLNFEYDLGSHTFSREEIKRFGAAYDPQYFHVDEDLAQHSHFGGLIASGWHTASVGHRLLVEGLAAQTQSMIAAGEMPGEPGPSPGIGTMEFKTPVRPNDTVNYRFMVLTKRPSKSLPGWGLLNQQITAINQHGEIVYRVEIAGFTKMRDFTPTLAQRVGTFIYASPLLRKLIKK